MDKRRMCAEDRKIAIVKAALPLFARKGFAETTTKDLARAAGVSEPLLYKHFPSKEALYLEIQNHSCKETDDVAQRLELLKPSTSTLVRLVYYLMGALITGRPAGVIKWDMRHRLMIKSFLEDGTFARLAYRNRFDHFCSRIEACLQAAIDSGDVVKSPVPVVNRALFVHHVGAWIALVQLQQRSVLDYQATREELLHQAMWFVLRGMGLTDKALVTYYKPEELSRSFAEAGI